MSSALIIVPWQQYEFDGDLNLFRLHYDQMKRYLNYLGTRADNGIADFGLARCAAAHHASRRSQNADPQAADHGLYFAGTEIAARTGARNRYSASS